MYNVRLRVEGKKSVSKSEFQHKGLDDDGDETTAPLFCCKLCKRTFHSVQTLQSHVKSTAHLMRKEQRILARDSEAASALTSTSLGSAAVGLHRRHRTHHKDPEMLKEVKPKVAPDDREADVDASRCFFCGLQSSDMETNLKHLLVSHQFTIPLQHRCVDVRGLMEYLSRKVNGLLCFVCGLDSKRFASLEALRGHMLAMNHEYVELNPEYQAFYEGRLDDDQVRKDDAPPAEHIVAQGGKRIIFRRGEGGLVQQRKDTKESLIQRHLLTAQSMEALTVIRKERLEAMRPQLKQAEQMNRLAQRHYQHLALRVGLRNNKSQPKGFDGEGEFN